MHHIVLWKWHHPTYRERFTADHVNHVAAMLRRNCAGLEFRIVLITDDAAGVDPSISVYPLWRDHSDMNNICGAHLPSCYRRLRLFDPDTQARMEMYPGDRIVSIDLDAVICQPIAPMLERKERYLGWFVHGTHHRSVYNGSLFMFTAGDLADVWLKFHADTSPKEALAAGYLGSDQGWLSYCLLKNSWASGWIRPEVVSYSRDVMQSRTLLAETRIVFFNGRRKPWHRDVQRQSPWIGRYWRI